MLSLVSFLHTLTITNKYGGMYSTEYGIHWKGGRGMGWVEGAHGVLLNVMILMIHLHDAKK